MFAVIDVEANYLLHKAFQYTTFTSIQVKIPDFEADLELKVGTKSGTKSQICLWIIISYGLNVSYNFCTL